MNHSINDPADESLMAESPSGIRPFSWFRIQDRVGRAEYAAVGVGLAAVKYLVEAVAVYLLTGMAHTPADFLNPWLNSKAPFLNDAPWIGLTWLLFTLPFVWVAIAMSLRRAADIGLSPWLGMFMLIPLINLLVMFLFAVLPSDLIASSDVQKANEDEQALADAFRPGESLDHEFPRAASSSPGIIIAVFVGCLTQLIVGGVSVWVFNVYGVVLFFSSPVIAGAITGFVLNSGTLRTSGVLFGTILLMNLFSFIAMLCVGLDGAICLLMAFPLLAPLSFLGALAGCAIATAGLRGSTKENAGMVGWMIFLPFCLFLESWDNQIATHAVTTTVIVDAPAEEVWEQVVAFPEITAELPWFFQLGIAAPMRAKIDGMGVGAVRYCEFTTGAFVEPIRVWDPPHHLAFDVIEQPNPMTEWTPFPHLHPPHLKSGLESRHGEFRLETLPDGRTRLSGTTWYQLDVRPRLYWKIWADPTLHAIHHRVLHHIAEVAESNHEK